MSKYEKMLENKMNDEIKLAGPEALVPEELEKHLIQQPTEITTTAIDLEFLPTDAKEDRGVQNLEFVQHSWLSRVMRRMTLSPTRGRIRWRHGGDCRSDMIR